MKKNKEIVVSLRQEGITWLHNRYILVWRWKRKFNLFNPWRVYKDMYSNPVVFYKNAGAELKKLQSEFPVLTLDNLNDKYWKKK